MRSLSSGAKAMLAGGSVLQRVIVRLSLPSGTLYFSDAPDDISWGGHTYSGLDQALQFDAGSPSTAGRPQPSELSISATDPAMLSLAFDSGYYGAKAEVALLLYDTAGAPLEEHMLEKGRLDAITLDQAEADPANPDKVAPSTIRAPISPAADQLARLGTRVRSDADQRAHRDSTDGFFKDVGMVGRVSFVMGQQSANQGGGSSGGGAGEDGGGGVNSQ
jgi:hypothetical protein